MTGVENQDIDEGEALAAEYVLGLLDADERRIAESRLGSDPAFAADVARWWERLSPLLEAEPGELPSADLWRRIEAALDQSGRAAEAVKEPIPAPTPQPRRARGGAASEPARRRGGLGRMLAAACLGAVIAGGAAAGFLAYRDWSTPRPAGILVAQLSPTEGETLYVAALDADRQAIVVTPTRILPADDRARQLWIIGADGEPRSAGLLASPDQTSAVPLADDLFRLAQTGVSLAVSLEAPGGSTTGKPQGPVIASGPLVQTS